MIFSVLIIFFSENNVKAEEKWNRVKSANFELVGNADDKDILKIAYKLEQFRLVLQKVFNNPLEDSTIPTVVIVFKDEKSFQKFKPVEKGKIKEWVSGYFLTGQNSNYIAFAINDDKKLNYKIIFHEYTHYLINEDLKNSKIPTWLSEGLAGYFEKLEIEDNKNIELGKTDRAQLNLLKTKGFLTEKDFFNTNNLPLSHLNKDEISLFYAQSWALVHYLFHEKYGVRKRQLEKFKSLIYKGENYEKAFSDSFETDYKTILNELKSYIFQKDFKSSHINVEKELNISEALNLSPLSRAETYFYQGDLLLKLDRSDEAEILLKTALAIEPENTKANISLGILKMNRHDFKEARKYLEKAIQTDEKDYLAYYTYANIISRESADRKGNISSYSKEDSEKMFQSLRNAILLKPDFLESYSLFAFVSFVQKQNIDEALEYINKGILKNPENITYRLRKAELLMLKEDFENSRYIVKNILDLSFDDKTKELAQNTLLKIENYQGFIERSKQNRSENKYLIEENRVLTADELAELSRRIEVDSINENLRKLKIDEQRILGKIVKVECDSKGILFNLVADKERFQFINQTFNEIVFYTYKIELKNGSIGCESNLSNYNSIITFKKLESSIENEKYSGKIISIEFVPSYFVFR